MRRFDTYGWMLALFLLLSAGPAKAQDQYVVEPLPFSSRVFNDFSPVFFQEGIVFCSDRRTSILQGYVANESNQAQLELFLATKDGEGGWNHPAYFAEELRSIKFEGPAAFTPDMKTIYFTRNFDVTGRKNRKSGNPNYGIFVSIFEDGRWTSPQPFVYNDPVKKTGHPTISPDGSKLFFASDQAGGYGGSDLYICTMENGSWSRPVNLGPEVNGPGNEMFPFAHASGRLYFSSDKPGGEGGLDIYFSLYLENGWLEPVALGPPFNSRDDDFAFIAENDLSSGYFTSSRSRTDNIYTFRSNLVSMDQCKLVEENSFTYEIFEPGTRDLDTLTYEYEWDLDQGVVKRGRVVEHTFKPGEHLLKLSVVDTLTGAIMASVAEYPLMIEPIEQVYFNAPDTVAVGERIDFSGEGTYLPEWMIGNYYWNFGDGSGGTGKEISHVFQIPGNYEVQLIVETTGTNAETRKRICGTKHVVVLRRTE